MRNQLGVWTPENSAADTTGAVRRGRDSFEAVQKVAVQNILLQNSPRQATPQRQQPLAEAAAAGLPALKIRPPRRKMADPHRRRSVFSVAFPKIAGLEPQHRGAPPPAHGRAALTSEFGIQKRRSVYRKLEMYAMVFHKKEKGFDQGERPAHQGSSGHGGRASS